jgi:hypothetical protein
MLISKLAGPVEVSTTTLSTRSPQPALAEQRIPRAAAGAQDDPLEESND